MTTEIFDFDNDTITIHKEAVKKYGLGAIILQEAFNYYESEKIPLKPDEWHNTFLWYIPVSTIKRILTMLKNDNKIVMNDEYIILNAKPLRRQKIDHKPDSDSDNKKDNLTWEMAVTICKVVGQAENMMTPNKYLRFAKQLLEAGHSKEYIWKRYGPDGWWYKNKYKGQKGERPNTYDIRTTINDTEVQITNPSSKDGFWN